jgi:uncharacterized protein (TIGR02145 family)
MKKLYVFPFFLTTFLLIQFGTLKTYALNYTISFTGGGASTSVESVIVQNLTKGTTVTVTSGSVLNLSDCISSVSNPSESVEGISIYPNPMTEKSIVSFYSKHTGATQINVFGLDGRKIISLNRTLLQGDNSFQLSIPQGTYALQINGVGFSYNSKVISQMNCQINPQISFYGNENQSINKPQKSKNAATTMLYNDGDQLLYKGISGNYTTIVTDKPTSSKTTNFDFVECKDGDGNYYAVVKIGNQTWMAENLKTTKYNDGTNILLLTIDEIWGSIISGGCYCWQNNDSINKNKYGALYNWYAVNTGKLAPIGWRVATDSQWTTLENYLIVNGYNYDGSISDNKCAKSLAATTIWISDTSVGASGNDLSRNNSSGFSALPSGYRFPKFSIIGRDAIWWTSTSSGTYAWCRDIFHSDNFVTRLNNYKWSGLSVRCIKD